MPVKRTEPSIGISNPNFRYRRAVETDISKTFAGVRRQMREAAAEAATGQQPLDLGAAGAAVVQLPARPARGAA